MSETQSATSTQTLPPHFSCDCVPDLGPAHCHRCSEIVGAPVESEIAPCKDLVESLAYSTLLSTHADASLLAADASLLAISEAFDAQYFTMMVVPVGFADADAPVVVNAAPKPTAPPVPAPPKNMLVSAQERQAKAAALGPWRFTHLARGQLETLGLTKRDIVTILDGSHMTVPSSSGTATNHYGNGLLIMVDADGECIISVIERQAPDSAQRSTRSQKAHSGGSGRSMPSNVRELLTALKAHGFTTELGGTGHHLVTHPDHPGVRISVPSSPSDRRSYPNAVSDIKRRTGIDITKKEA
jgi:hypothetical protein